MVALLFVVSALLVPHVGFASPTRGLNQMSGQGALRSAPLTQVAGGGSPSTASFGQFSIVQRPVNDNAQVTITISLKAGAGFNAYLSAINNPESNSYRHYLTASQVGSLYGVSASQYSALESYFQSYGLTVTPSAERLSLSVTGTVSAMQSALHTTISADAYSYASQGLWQPMFGNSSGIAGTTTLSPTFYVAGIMSLPSPIAGLVTGISGLDGAIASPMLVLPQGMYPGMNASATVANGTSYTIGGNTYYSGTGAIQGISDANYTWGYANYFAQFFGFPSTPMQFLYPSTMHALTGANNLWNGKDTIGSESDQGQGVTVAVIEVGFIPTQWLSTFSQQVWGNPNQIANRITYIGVGTPSFGLPNTFNGWVTDGGFYGWQLETALDIEYLATMAPQAHIDLIAVGAPYFSSFDMAYAATATYLSTGSSSSVPSGLTVFGGTGVQSSVLSAQAASVSITSNSYGAPEWETVFFGSPVYVTVENTLLHEMNAVGITNFFASGDYGAEFMASAATIPGMAHGSTAVGGGQLTATGVGGAEFPITSNWVYANSAFLNNQPLSISPATGVGSFTYWSYYFGEITSLQGYIGGGFGQSIMEQQPWWQNALDTYSTGAAINPIVSGSAAFNMTVYAGFAFFGYQFASWNYYYGGTSFATPISAGEWALIEEQANVAFGTPKMGDINPILFAAHNAYEAGVSTFTQNPYIDMQNIGQGFDWAPFNGFAAYYNNLSINQPSDQVLPSWYATLFNPAGPGWNYLQGLGMIRVQALDNELIGQTPSTQHALMNEPFAIEQVTASGTLAPITELQNGTTYTLQVVLANGQAGGYYNVVAYSGGPNDGTYGGGVYTTLQTGSNGQFTYTPIYNNAGQLTGTSGNQSAVQANVPTGGSEYGYFSIVSAGSSEWAFQPFAVQQPPATGTLTIGVINPYGQFETSAAEVPMFTTGMTGFYNLYGLGEAYLNGQPVSNAVVYETVANVTQPQAGVGALGLIGESYAPGTVLGHFLSDARGNYNFWTDAFIAETNGPLYTQVVTLQATYHGLVSNPVTVYIEPQSGSFYPNVALNSAGNALVGSVMFNDMKYVNWVNISIGNQTGQFVNYTFSQPENTYNGIIPIDFTNLPAPGTPIQLSMVAEGANNLGYTVSIVFFGTTYTFVIPDMQSPMYWSDPVTIANPGTAPTASLASSASPTVNGNVTLSYAGSWQASGATGTLTVSYGNTVSTLLSTGTLTGSYVWNSANYADGFYTLTYTVSTPTGLHSSSSVVLYVDNTASQLNAEIVKLQGELSSAQSTIKTLQSELASDNTTIATMQSQINSLNTQVSTLTSQLSAETAKYNATAADLVSAQSALKNETALYNATAAALATAKSSLNASNATIATLQSKLSTESATIASQQSTIASLQSSLSTDNATIASQSAQISTLKAQIATLQSELNAKKDFVPPAWYDVFGGAGALLLVALGVVALLIGVVIGRHRKAEKSPGSPPMTNLFAMAAVPPAQVKASTVHITYRELRK